MKHFSELIAARRLVYFAFVFVVALLLLLVTLAIKRDTYAANDPNYVSSIAWWSLPLFLSIMWSTWLRLKGIGLHSMIARLVLVFLAIIPWLGLGVLIAGALLPTGWMQLRKATETAKSTPAPSATLTAASAGKLASPLAGAEGPSTLSSAERAELQAMLQRLHTLLNKEST